MLNDIHDNSVLDAQLRKLNRLAYPSADLARAVLGPDSILLLSIPKSGTHWMRFLLANYSHLLEKRNQKQIGFRQLNLLSQPLHRVLAGERPLPVRRVFAAYGYSYLTFEHPVHGARIWSDCWAHQGKKLCMYRNPLDFLVSAYFYYFEYRDGNSEQADHPRDILVPYLRLYALAYRFITEKVVPAGNAHLVCYEHLRRDCPGHLGKALEFLGVPIDDEILARTIAVSVPEVARKQEELRGHMVGRLSRGRFVRDGSSGQWRAYFDENDVKEARRTLAECGVDLDEFVLDEC